MIEKTLPDEEEYKITFDEWQQAWGRLLHLLETHLTTIYASWNTHFERILYHPTCTAKWDTWCIYDIELRKQALHTGIDPRVHSREIWVLADSWATEAQMLVNIDRQIAMITPKPPATHSSSSSYSSLQTQTRNTLRPFWNNLPPGRCFVCGDRSGHHYGCTCTASHLINGRPCVLTINTDGKQ